VTVEQEPMDLAAKLGRLFETMRPPGSPDREYSNEEVARGVADAGGPTISGTYVWMLRTGRRDNPTKHHLEALARFFGVSPAYFFDDERAPQIDEQLAAAAAMRDAGVRSVAMRASGLSPQSLAAVMSMVDRVRELEALHKGGTDGDSRTAPQG
jgi:transcriptional regulator with XRE-family HTH domain